MKLTIVFCLFFVRCVIAGDESPLINRLPEDCQLRALCQKAYNALNDVTDVYDAVNSRVINEDVQIEVPYSQVMNIQARIDTLRSEIVNLETALSCSDGYCGLFRQYSLSDLSLIEQGVVEQYNLAEKRGSIARSYDPEYEDKVPVLVERIKPDVELKIERKKKSLADLQTQLIQARSRLSAAEASLLTIRITIEGVICTDGEGYLLSDIIKMKRLYQQCFNQTESIVLRQGYDEIQRNMDVLDARTATFIRGILASVYI